jgi:translocation and assembly module TamB
MGRLLYRLTLFAVVVLSFIASPAAAQNTPLAEELAEKDDRGFIVGLLESALGGEGRIVRVESFQGALSRNATVNQITIADDTGVWLTLDDVQLEWNRAALLRGRIEVEHLSATHLTLARLPITPNDTLPSAEASGFSLPNLPVSVSIKKLKLDRIELGKSVLGEPAEMTLEAAIDLAEGSGQVALTAVRIDGQQGRFVANASYQADSQMAEIDLDLTEAAEGLVSHLLNLPGKPDLRLQISGEGSIDDLVTDISLKTQGTSRLAGQVVLQGSSSSGRDFSVDLNGDLTPLLPTEYRHFFGNRTALKATGRQSQDGTVDLTNFDLETGAVALNGDVALDQNYWPTRLMLSGQITPTEEGSVVLPFDDGSTSIEQANLEIIYDAANSGDLEAVFDVANLVTSGVSVRSTQLSVRGALENVFAGQNKLNANVSFHAKGAKFDDPAQQQAIGDQISGSLRLKHQLAGPLRLEDIKITGTEYTLAGALIVDGLADAFETKVDVSLRTDQLSQFSALAGADIRGQAELSVSGTADFGGAFNLRLEGNTTDLEIGIEQADKALVGVTKLDLAVIRDESGTRISGLEITNQQVQATGVADLKTGASEVEFDLTLANSAEIDTRLKGPLALTGRAVQDQDGWSVDTAIRGPFDATTTIVGRATGAEPSLQFNIMIPEIQRVSPQFRGSTKLVGTVRRDADTWTVNTDLEGPYRISGKLEGTITGATPTLRYTLNIPNLAAVGAQIDGPLTLNGTATQQGSAWRVDTALSGLSGMRAQLDGVVLETGDVDLVATGQAPLALANPFLAPRNLQGQATFDFSLKGPPALSSLSGTITTSEAQLSAPTLRIALRGIASQIAVDRGRAQVNVAADVSSGGRIAVTGPVSLSGELDADLAVSLTAVRLIDPSLYDTSIDGQLSIRGPLSGNATIAGQVNVGETNIQVPASQATGFSIIPQIIHRNPSQAVRQTLRRAGLDTTSRGTSSTNATSYALDINVDAPSRIFVRGRGLDAELGGALSLQGRTDRLVSTGRFNLIRGRLDILGKRFVLDEGSIALQGNLDPFLRFVATTETAAGTASVIIEGPASQPDVKFSSSPEAPQDEVLAQIIFGRDSSTLSAFQALQLASAVTTLAGKGGEGIVSKLRRGFGLDDLDVTTDAQGTTGLRLGKYISDNIYTDVTIGSANTAGVSINIDLSKSVTARGQVKSNGDSSIGIFLERDY